MAIRNGTTERSIDGKHLVRLVATDRGTCAERFLDDRDQAIVDRRLARMDSIEGPRVGDWIVFADGVERRISHSYYVADGWDENTYQTSAGGSWYLEESGHCSFSGSLYPTVPGGTLTDTGELRDGSAWIFHHDWHTAGGGVDFRVPLRVFASSEEAPR
jgi:hypothetical protein